MVINNIQLTNKIIKYLVYALIVYTLFAYVPQKQLPVSDVLLMTTIIICSFVLLDILTPSDNTESFDIIENLEEDVTPSVLLEDEEDPEDPEDDSQYLNYTKPLVLKELQDQEILNDDEVEEIIKVCNDKDQCSFKLKELLNNGKVNNQQFLELHVVFGLDNFESLQDLYLQERLNREQVYLIAVAISSKSTLFLEGILKKYTSDNILTKEDSDKIINNTIEKSDSIEDKLKVSNGEKYLANMVEKGEISTLNAKIIHEKCLSPSLDSCSIQLNKFKKENIITNAQAFALLKAYNKPAIDSIKQVDDSEIKGIDRTPDIGDTMKTGQLLKDDKLLKQARSISESRQKDIDRLLKENDKLQDIIDDKESEETKLFQDIQKQEEKMNAACQKDKEENYKKIQKLLKNKRSEKYNKNHDMNYNIYTKEETTPLGSFTDDFTNSFTHGFSNLATNKWRPPQYDNPICKIEEQCNTCNNEFEGYPVDLTNWDHTRKILPKDNININYLRDKLNGGKA